MEALTSFASTHRLARLSVDQGVGAGGRLRAAPATVMLVGHAGIVPGRRFPAGDGRWRSCAGGERSRGVDDARSIADLFAGIGTFALAVRASYAAEASRDSAAALKRAAPSIAVEHRDLYRRPLDAAELNRFDAVVLDPPRAGAAEQVKALSASSVRRIVYVSCNPATFARDARTLVDGGYQLEWVRPVGQFRWSTHVELAACFTRDA